MPKKQSRQVATVRNNLAVRLSQPVAPSEGALVDYEREDETVVYVPVINVGAMLDRHSEIASRKSMDVCWRIPSVQDGTNRGNLLKLKHTKVTVRNPSGFRLFLLAARPFGFEVDPSGLAAWEALHPQSYFELAPGGEWSKTFPHIHNNYIVPKVAAVKDVEMVHLFSLSMAREGTTVAGAIASYPDVAVELLVSTTYSSNGPSTGTNDLYGVIFHPDSTHIGKVVPPPPTTTSVSVLTHRGAPIYGIKVVAPDMARSGAQVGACMAVFVVGKDLVPEPDGLDKTVCYAMNTVVIGGSCMQTTIQEMTNEMPVGVARYLTWMDPVVDSYLVSVPAGWYFTIYPSGHERFKTKDGKPSAYNGVFVRPDDKKKMPSMTAMDNGFIAGSVQLTPVLPQAKAVAATGRIRMSKIRTFGGEAQPREWWASRYDASLEDGPWEKLLEAASVVVRVLKTALVIAGAVGLAENDLTNAQPDADLSDFIVTD